MYVDMQGVARPASREFRELAFASYRGSFWETSGETLDALWTQWYDDETPV